MRNPKTSIKENSIILKSPVGKIILNIQSDEPESRLEIFRAGKSQQSGNIKDNLGWYSPTYGIKIPALSVRYSISASIPVKVTSTFNLEK